MPVGLDKFRERDAKWLHEDGTELGGGTVTRRVRRGRAGGGLGLLLVRPRGRGQSMDPWRITSARGWIPGASREVAARGASRRARTTVPDKLAGGGLRRRRSRHAGS